ncbi:MFS transporter [Glacieibacterium frigidum]|uniref:MFS transporter n=1 Tax=Glacieibacterium frigidum TaxID=2593303 RepID=A0A552U896_9SPHN|nr:MFS transporter [Glacieibacterium frigidum]TRW14446.1 MFS transporter [Glacieibacterium frigidum]
MASSIAQDTEAPADFGEFRRGWKVVLASLLGIGLGLSPMPFYTMGVFAPHLSKEFGWSIGQIMGGLAVTTITVLFAAPLVGVLATRIGVRRVALASMLLFGLAFMTMALSTSSLTQFYVTWAIIALVGAGTLPITFTRAVNHWFDRRKGLALGLSLMGTGLFAMICKPFLAIIIADHGWRAGYLALGALPLLIALPTAYLLLHDTDDHEDAAVRTTTPGGLTMREALRDWRFWLIAIALLPISFALGGPVPNLETMLSEGGIDAGSVVALTPLIGLFALIGRLVGGWLLDRFWAPAVAFVILSLPALSCWLLAGGGLDMTTAAIALSLVGFALGVEYDVVAFFVARYFGLRSYSAIYGALYVSFALGGGIGPLVFGWAHDRQGSYDAVLMGSLVVLVIASASLLLLGRYRSYAEEAIRP